ncbi:phage antirepressor [Nocardiopsis synnemataformans]|uniref:phage antirepressor n=1 Tax=Nocardiopsis synnemataformans TaxID=61305 RepID=UPI003EB97AD9
MSLSLQPFTFPDTGQPVRAVELDGDPWFVGRDAALVLGYTNTRKALGDHVPAGHRKGNESFPLPDLGLHPQTVLISEAGLYRLIMRSHTPEADRFQEWVTAEVLPTLRRTGRYEVAPQVPQTYAQALRAAADAVEAREVAERRAAELTPAAEAWDDLAASKGDHAVREAAQILSRVPGIRIGQNTLFAKLRDLGWIDKSGQPYQHHVGMGRLVRRTTSYTHPHTLEPVLSAQVRITPRGLADLRQVLAATAQLTLDGAQ